MAMSGGMNESRRYEDVRMDRLNGEGKKSKVEVEDLDDI
jgi:hypothetical protein